MPEGTASGLNPTVAFDFFQQFKEAHDRVGLPYDLWFDHWFVHGYVFKGPDYFLVGGHDSENPKAWLVWWAATLPGMRTEHETVRLFLSLMPYYKPLVAWNRSLKNKRGLRYYSTDRLLSLTAPSSGHESLPISPETIPVDGPPCCL